MKFSTQVQGGILMGALVAAFPHMVFEELQKRGTIDGRAGPPDSGVPIPPELSSTFDAKKQYVSNTGDHAWQAPQPGDQRGPCPGLNAMANHNYIPRTGVATIREYIQGTFDVFGMSRDLGGFLAVLGATLDGDLQKWSIGGPTPLVGLRGTGLIGSHNKYETDASPVRPDQYQKGNNYKVDFDQFKALYDMQKGVPDDQANYNLAVLQEFRNQRWDQSLNQNPYFFNGPFAGVLVQPAAYTFIYRFMGNKSAEHPEGILNRNVLKSFFGVTENADGSFSGGLGQERIPDNWYKRAIGDEYSIPFFLGDVIYEASLYPKFLSIGGNTNGPNTFAGVQVENLTNGVFNSAQLLQGNNLFCFAYQSSQIGAPDLLTGALGRLTQALQAFAPEAANYIATLGCPQLAENYDAQLRAFPGYNRRDNVYKN